LDIGQNLILEIDYQGAFHVKKIFKHVVSIFILPPSMLILEERLNSRGKDSKENIQKRLSVARHEMSHLDKFDYVIINDDFKKAVADLKSILVMGFIAEDLKTEKQIISYRGLIESFKI
jgi:guanylate kinase